jgi:hypothetical protein
LSGVDNGPLRSRIDWIGATLLIRSSGLSTPLRALVVCPFGADNYIDQAQIEMAKRAHAEMSSDEFPRRRTMLAWLKPFIARNKPSEWNGIN